LLPEYLAFGHDVLEVGEWMLIDFDIKNSKVRTLFNNKDVLSWMNISLKAADDSDETV
jgi:hypothetical protein